MAQTGFGDGQFPHKQRAIWLAGGKKFGIPDSSERSAFL